MSLESVVQSALGSCAANGAHQDVAIQGTLPPYIVWTLVASSINNNLGGASNAQNARVQVDCYAATPILRRAIGDAVEAAMAAASFSNVELNQAASFENETRLFRLMLEYSIWTNLPI